jgi:hypothetical protein
LISSPPLPDFPSRNKTPAALASVVISKNANGPDRLRAAPSRSGLAPTLPMLPIEPTLPMLPIEPILAIEPIEPMLNKLPMDPIEPAENALCIEPTLATESRLAKDATDRRL